MPKPDHQGQTPKITSLSDGARRRAFFSMMVALPLGGAGIDILLPSLPAMAEHFKTSETAVQSSIVVYMAGYGISQFLMGPVTDHFGRRKPILLGTVLFILAAIAITLSDAIWMVLALRFIQGIGAASSAVGARSIVVDCYQGKERAKAANWMTISWAAGPVLSPGLGGYLQDWFGWTSTFWFIAGWGVLVLLVVFFIMPETHPRTQSSKLLASFKPFGQMIRHRVYLFSALAMGSLITVLYGFEVLAPFYVITDMQYTPIVYGHLQLVMGCLWLLGSLSNRLLSAYLPTFATIIVCGVIACSISIIMIFLDLSGAFSIWWLALPAGIIFFLASTIWPNLFSLCLSAFPDAGGVANAGVSSLFVVISAVFSFFGILLVSQTAWPMWCLLTFAVGICLFIVVFFLGDVFPDLRKRAKDQVT